MSEDRKPEQILEARAEGKENRKITCDKSWEKKEKVYKKRREWQAIRAGKKKY